MGAASRVSLDSAACSASLKTVLATRTVGTKATLGAPMEDTENGVGPLGINPATAPIDANNNTKALSRFMVLYCFPVSMRQIGICYYSRDLKKYYCGWVCIGDGDGGGKNNERSRST